MELEDILNTIIVVLVLVLLILAICGVVPWEVFGHLDFL